MDQMEENEIEIESVIIETNTDSSIPITPLSNNGSEEKAEKLIRFPLTRVKHLVKMDPDVHLCSNEALFLLTKATVNINYITFNSNTEIFHSIFLAFSPFSLRP